jgi:ribosome-associated protein
MPASPSTSSIPQEIPETVRGAVEAILEKKGVDPRVLYVGEVSDFTDYFLVVSGGSDRQVRALADAVDERLRELGHRPLAVEGLREGKWVLIDYGDLVVHVFDPERRDFYRIERLWSDAPRLTV